MFDLRNFDGFGVRQFERFGFRLRPFLFQRL
jgi:hypothetical protein